MIEPYKTVVHRLLEALLERYGDRFITLAVFGSVARMEMRMNSDVDLLLIIESLPRTRLKRQFEFTEIEERIESTIREIEKSGYRIEFSPIIRTPEEISKLPPILLDMVDDAVIVYDRDEFFKKVLDRLRAELKRLGSRRIKIGNRWYWDLKPDCRFGEVIRIE